MKLFSPEYIKKSIEEFQERIKTEKDFCEELFREQTIRILAMKYEYYILNKTHFKDHVYDMGEKLWYIMGIALGNLKEDETSPCVGFDENHPLSKEAIKLAEKWK